MENQWLTYAKRLQAIASTGLFYAKEDFDRERYSEIAQIANGMLAEIGSVPVERIVGLVSDFSRGYATPKVDVRGAVIKDGSILLVREKGDGLWSLPGGFADVGSSAAENVVKEILEETGLSVAARRVYAVRHKAKHPYGSDARDFYKLFFLCDPIDESQIRPGHEVTDAAFFSRDQIPPLSRGRVIESDIDAAFAFLEGSLHETIFD